MIFKLVLLALAIIAFSAVWIGATIAERQLKDLVSRKDELAFHLSQAETSEPVRMNASEYIDWIESRSRKA